MHATIFWGFMVLTAGTVEILIQGVFSGFSYRADPAGIRSTSLYARVAGRFRRARARRHRVRVLSPARAASEASRGRQARAHDALIILGLIGGSDGDAAAGERVSRVSSQPDAVGPEKFVSRALAMAFRHLAPRATRARNAVFWWAHALLVLTFLNYLPYSKHLHVVTSLINVYLSNTSWPRPRARDAADGSRGRNVETFGAADVEQLTWKNLLDGYSCTECGRCTAACPANITGKAAQPAQDRHQHAPAADGEGARCVTGDRMALLAVRRSCTAKGTTRRSR